MGKKVGILIPVYNRIDITKKGLKLLYESLSNYTKAEVCYEIIVIDDGSSDGTSDYIKKNYPAVVLLSGDGNLWWSGCINVGVNYALKNGYSFLLLWNDDIIPEKTYFDKLSDCIVNHDNRMIIGSSIFDLNTHKLWFYGARYNNFTGEIKHIRDINRKVLPNCLTGMGTLIPIECVKEIGMWDSVNFPQYYGDVDFTLRAFEAGYCIRVLDSLIIYNDTSQSSFNQEKSISKYLKSLTMTQSRYNIIKDIKFNQKHSKSILWPYAILKKHIKYFLRNII